MKSEDRILIEKAKKAAEEVLVHNMHGPYRGLPRVAGWGYPEPYTRDLMIATLGILLLDKKDLIESVRRCLETLAKTQTRLGHIPSLVHDTEARGASDTTPLFLIALALYRQVTGEQELLEPEARKAMAWMEYQSPSDRVLVAQLPTSDWRDEQWVLGYGLFVNTLVYSYLRLFRQNDRASQLKDMMAHFALDNQKHPRGRQEGLVLRHKPYYALWSYKLFKNERFDLLGNSLAILTGIASPTRANAIIAWVEKECAILRERGELAVKLPPNLFPYVQPGDSDWRPRDETYNLPGEYQNGGIWPWVCGFYVAALVAAGRHRLAEEKLIALTALVQPSREARADFGFNEWLRAQDGISRGEDWQSWSAGMYIYAVECVQRKNTPFFDDIRAP